jgi:nitrogen-specific signal transduction histidine kinase
MRVCQFRHDGKTKLARQLWRAASRKGLQVIFYCGALDCQTQQRALMETGMENSRKLPDNVVGQLRTLAHDLSNSLETILQAAYLLSQAEMDAKSKKWAHMIDTAAQDAARINREIREILRSQS